jgi:hypothetical protein
VALVFSGLHGPVEWSFKVLPLGVTHERHEVTGGPVLGAVRLVFGYGIKR